MKVDYQKEYEQANKASLVKIRKMLKKPKAIFTTGDFQRASPEKFERMLKRVAGW